MTRKGKKRPREDAPIEVQHHTLARRPLSAFMIFCGEQRAGVLEAAGGERLKPAKLGGLLLDAWRELSGEEKDALEARAVADEKYLARTGWVSPNEWRDAERRDHAAEEMEKPSKRGRKSPRNPGAPKNAMTAYMFFSKAVRPRLRKSNPTATFGELGKLIGNGWRQLPHREREPYEILAQLDRQRFSQAKSDASETAAAAGPGVPKAASTSAQAPAAVVLPAITMPMALLPSTVSRPAV